MDCAGYFRAGVAGLFAREEPTMRLSFRNVAVGLLAVALAGPVLIAGCEEEVRTYDAGYGDYHTWNHGEVVYYNNWEHETHRDHVDFAKRNDAEKKEYYSWRHSQNGNHPGH
ncbi:MAG: hypothetical protein WCF88_04570 [Candidatus Acidiferrales bacterium]